jgi:hypothetical protein
LKTGLEEFICNHHRHKGKTGHLPEKLKDFPHEANLEFTARVWLVQQVQK